MVNTDLYLFPSSLYTCTGRLKRQVNQLYTVVGISVENVGKVNMCLTPTVAQRYVTVAEIIRDYQTVIVDGIAEDQTHYIT